MRPDLYYKRRQRRDCRKRPFPLPDTGQKDVFRKKMLPEISNFKKSSSRKREQTRENKSIREIVQDKSKKSAFTY